MHSQGEIKKILDQGMLTRSILETEVSMRKCHMYSETAQNKEVKAFFRGQANALDDLTHFFKDKLTDII